MILGLWMILGMTIGLGLLAGIFFRLREIRDACEYLVEKAIRQKMSEFDV